MTTPTLFSILVAVAGFSSLRFASRLAPLPNEYPLKTLLATLLAGAYAFLAFRDPRVPGLLTGVVVVVTPLYVFGPLGLLALVRSGAWKAAKAAMNLLYWTPDGRAAVGRLLAQAALQRGDATAALTLTTRQDPVLLSQAYVLQGDFESVLALERPPEASAGDNAHLLAAARIEALLALGHVEQARHETGVLRTRFEAGRQGPLAYRAVILSEARLAAHAGDLAATRELLERPLAGVPPATLYEILATAAQRAGQREAAAKAYAAAYAAASGPARGRYEERLKALGAAPPTNVAALARRPLATYLLSGVLGLAYVLQVATDRLVGPLLVRGQLIDASDLIAAFVHAVPGVPDATAWWRYLTYAFLHANVLHIGLNVWVLLDLGRLFERRRGWGDLLAAFTAGTAAGAYATTVFQVGVPLVLVGASGGILGVAGALMAEVAQGRTAADRQLLRGLLQWMALLLLLSVALPNVSLWGHVGGLVGGFAYGAVRRRAGLGPRFSQAAGWFCVGLLLLALVSAVTSVVPLLP